MEKNVFPPLVVKPSQLDSHRIGVYATCYEGAVALCEACVEHHKLRILELTQCSLTFTEEHPHLVHLLKHNHTIETLTLSSGSLTDNNSKQFAEALAHNTGIQILDLMDNEFEDGFISTLADSLRVNRTLRELNLYACDLQDSDAILLAKVLKQNRVLETLNRLRNDLITYDGVFALAEPLETNEALLVLLLDYASDSAMSLASMLKSNKVLQFLRLAFNSFEPIEDGVAIGLMDSMYENTSLNIFDAQGIRQYVFRYNRATGNAYKQALVSHAALQSLEPDTIEELDWVDVVRNYCSRNAAIENATQAAKALTNTSQPSPSAAATGRTSAETQKILPYAAIPHVLTTLGTSEATWIFPRPWNIVLYCVLRKQSSDTVMWMSLRTHLLHADTKPVASRTRKRKFRPLPSLRLY